MKITCSARYPHGGKWQPHEKGSLNEKNSQYFPRSSKSLGISFYCNKKNCKSLGIFELVKSN